MVLPPPLVENRARRRTKILSTLNSEIGSLCGFYDFRMLPLLLEFRKMILDLYPS